MKMHHWLPSMFALAMLGCAQSTPTKQAPTASKGGAATPTSAAPVKSLLILAAASTRDALLEAGKQFTTDTGIEVKISADDSSKLAQQVVNGAPADLFFSANEKWADFVKDKGFTSEAKPLLGNTLVIVTPKGNPAKVAKPADLTAAAVQKLALAGPTVPAGIYARQALKSLKLLDELEAAKKIVSGDNVRVTLAYVERGEAEAGIVYGTDAAISKDVEAVYTFEPATHDKIVYPLVLLTGGAKNPAAKQFYQYLLSPPAAEIFRKYGFSRLAD